MNFGVGESPQIVQAPRAGVSGLHPYLTVASYAMAFEALNFEIIIGQPYSTVRVFSPIKI